jgi:MFS family permease
MAEADVHTSVSSPLSISNTCAILSSWSGQFNKQFWTFYCAALFFDFGFGLFFFLFNLYLTDLHLNEAILGQITAALTLGNVVGTIPAAYLSRRFGLRQLLLFTFIAAPLLCAARLAIAGAPLQIGLAFLTGLALCCWPICFSPMVAKLTDERSRATGFSLVFATGIGTGMLAGLAGGCLPGFLTVGAHNAPVAGIRIVLLLSCVLCLLGAWPIWKLERDRPAPQLHRRIRVFHPFLFRFLPAFVLWNVVTGSFPVFGSVYLQQALGMPLNLVGLMFSASQLIQFCMVLLTPFLFRCVGTINGIALAQMCTALAMLLLAHSSSVPAAAAYYLALNGALWMCGPGIYGLLMNRIPEDERSTASAIQNLSGALCQVVTSAVTGSCIVAFGYRPLLRSNSAFAVMAAVLFLVLTRAFQTSEVTTTPQSAATEQAT